MLVIEVGGLGVVGQHGLEFGARRVHVVGSPGGRPPRRDRAVFYANLPPYGRGEGRGPAGPADASPAGPDGVRGYPAKDDRSRIRDGSGRRIRAGNRGRGRGVLVLRVDGGGRRGRSAASRS